ncbi:MAG TPA: ABC transporter substrate-binding protein, partial [Ilumatobacteraceae bacterium]
MMGTPLRKATAIGAFVSLAVLAACGSSSKSAPTTTVAATTATTASAASTPAASTPAGSTPAASTPAGSTPAGSTPAGSTPAAGSTADTSGPTTTLSPDSYKDGANVTIRLAQDWTDFDIQHLPSASNVQLSLPAYDRLLDFDGTKQVPYLAESWTTTPTSVTFKLKDGPTCADGTKVTPTVVMNSFARLIDPATKFTNLVSLFGPGKLSMTADDATNTFTFTTDTPYSNLVYAFADPSTSIICPAGLVDPTKIATEMFGSGPYTLQSATHNDQLVFKLRDDYNWGPYGITSKTPGLPETLTYKIITDDTTAANELISGDLTLAKITGTEVDRLRKEDSLTYSEATLASSALMVFNERPGQLLQDQTLRQALLTAIDPALWRKTANGGYGTAATSYLASNAPCYNPATAALLPTPDVDAAKKVLTDAGYTFSNNQMLDKSGKQVSITVLGNLAQNSGPDYLAAQFTAMGVKVNLVKVDFTTYAADLNSTSF